MNQDPILTTLGVGVGQLFLYDNRVWVRTDRYNATTLINQGAGACMFGFMGQSDGEYDEEWTKFLETAVKLDNEKAEQVILESLKVEERGKS